MMREQAEAILTTHGITDRVVWIGYRSANSSYGEYDDVAGLFTPDSYTEFKFNTLPSKWADSIAKLMPGVYKYKRGLHGIHRLNLALPADKAIYDALLSTPGKDHAPIMVNGAPRLLPYWAFRQSGPVTILRHGAAATETQADPARWPFIDLHKGGHYTTSSEGCQTFIADEWAQARGLGYGAMDKYGQDHIMYCLVQL